MRLDHVSYVASHDQISDVVNRIEAIGKKHGLRIGTFGHAGDGNLHPTIVLDKDDPKEVTAAEAALAEITPAEISFQK